MERSRHNTLDNEDVRRNLRTICGTFGRSQSSGLSGASYTSGRQVVEFLRGGRSWHSQWHP